MEKYWGSVHSTFPLGISPEKPKISLFFWWNLRKVFSVINVSERIENMKRFILMAIMPFKEPITFTSFKLRALKHVFHIPKNCYQFVDSEQRTKHTKFKMSFIRTKKLTFRLSLTRIWFAIFINIIEQNVQIWNFKEISR